MNLFSDIRALVIDCLNAMVAAGDLPEGLDFKMSPWNPHGMYCMGTWPQTQQWFWQNLPG